MPQISRLLSYSVAALSITFGVLLLTGYVQLGGPGAPPQVRITMGVVMFLLGAYRAVVTATQGRERDRG